MTTLSSPTYANFDLLIDRGPAGYRSRVLHSLAGEAIAEFSLPFTPDVAAWNDLGLDCNRFRRGYASL